MICTYLQIHCLTLRTNFSQKQYYMFPGYLLIILQTHHTVSCAVGSTELTWVSRSQKRKSCYERRTRTVEDGKGKGRKSMSTSTSKVQNSEGVTFWHLSSPILCPTPNFAGALNDLHVPPGDLCQGYVIPSHSSCQH